MPTTPPRYQHDCEQCTFLGTWADDRHEYDLYHCLEGGSWPTVIARYSSEGPDYTSGLPLAPISPPLAEAKRRAEELGLSVKGIGECRPPA